MSTWNARRRLVAMAVVSVLSAADLAAARAQDLRERWTGAIDLHQGDTGTIEITLAGGMLSGRIVVHRNGTSVETPINGEWARDRISFARRLSETSVQPFRGTVVGPAAGPVTIDGQFAAGFAGRWTCTLTRADAPTEGRRREPTSTTGNTSAATDRRRRDPQAGAQPPALVDPIAGKRPFAPVSAAGVLLDFVERAPSARWTNAWTVLGFPGADTDSRGYARQVSAVRLEDGKTYARGLDARPHAQPRGRIMGWYDKVTVPAGGAVMRSGLGFREGATGSDGVYFVVRGEFPGYSGIDVRREYLKAYDGFTIQDFTQDLSRFKGLTGTVILSVDAGPKSAEQDLAVWIGPALVPADASTAFASFVGAAVGASRNGSQLVNAWGGKTGQLYGTVMLYLLFSNVDAPYSVAVESFEGGHSIGTTALGKLQPGQTEMWVPLERTVVGECRERIIFNGTYVGDIRYTISKSGN